MREDTLAIETQENRPKERNCTPVGFLVGEGATTFLLIVTLLVFTGKSNKNLVLDAMKKMGMCSLRGWKGVLGRKLFVFATILFVASIVYFYIGEKRNREVG